MRTTHPDRRRGSAQLTRMLVKHAIQLAPDLCDQRPAYRCGECAVWWTGTREAHPADDRCDVYQALRSPAEGPTEWRYVVNQAIAELLLVTWVLPEPGAFAGAWLNRALDRLTALAGPLAVPADLTCADGGPR